MALFFFFSCNGSKDKDEREETKKKKKQTKNKNVSDQILKQGSKMASAEALSLKPKRAILNAQQASSYSYLSNEC